MKILITGATGLVGSSIVKLCHEQQIQVNYLTTRRVAVENRENYHGFYWDPATKLIDPACFEGVTSIINLAGSTIARRWTKNRKRRILSSRINSLKTLAKGLEETGSHQITSLVSASAIGIYPSSPVQYYTEEETAIDQSFLGEVVSAWEKEADTLKKYGLKIVKVRSGLLLSRDGGALPDISKPIKYYAGAAFGSGEQWQSWIHVRDLARMYLFIIGHGLEGVYNGVAPNPVNNSKLIREIAKVLNKPLWLPNIPEFMMKLLFGEMAYTLYASQRVSNKKIENHGFDFRYSNICRALQDLYGNGSEKASDAGSVSNEFFS